jgi:hypothetical protein
MGQAILALPAVIHRVVVARALAAVAVVHARIAGRMAEVSVAAAVSAYARDRVSIHRASRARVGAQGGAQTLAADVDEARRAVPARAAVRVDRAMALGFAEVGVTVRGRPAARARHAALAVRVGEALATGAPSPTERQRAPLASCDATPPSPPGVASFDESPWSEGTVASPGGPPASPPPTATPPPQPAIETRIAARPGRGFTDPLYDTASLDHPE